MKKSLIASAVLMAAAAGVSGTGTDAAAAVPEVSKPGDEKLHPAMQELLVVVDEVAEQARYHPDPRVHTTMLAEALAKYFRTPD